uniref:Cytochrome P450 n=1 Tax=Oryza nivara TaxID=4536 RepID=A0A0E0GPQ0_ORYNI
MAASLLLELLPQQWQLSITSLILLAVSVVLIFWSRHRRNPSSRLKLPPGPTRLPIIGNLHQIGRLPHRSLGALAGWHGPVMALWLGTVPVVVLSSPKAAREALKVHDPECCSRSPSAGPRMLSYKYKDVAFSPYSNYVRDMRKLFLYLYIYYYIYT